MLISPTNKRLTYFHLLVSICSFTDIFLTGVILSNYRFVLGLDDDFMNHRVLYTLICLVQTQDIVLNFFKIQYTPT